MSNHPLAADDLRAAAEVHSELGPAYGDAVIEAFLEKIDQKIDARLDAKLASRPVRRPRGPEDPAHLAARRTLRIGAGIGAASVGVPLTVIASHFAEPWANMVPFLLVSWLGGSLVTVGVTRLVARIFRRPLPGGAHGSGSGQPDVG